MYSCEEWVRNNIFKIPGTECLLGKQRSSCYVRLKSLNINRSEWKWGEKLNRKMIRWTQGQKVHADGPRLLWKKETIQTSETSSFIICCAGCGKAGHPPNWQKSGAYPLHTVVKPTALSPHTASHPGPQVAPADLQTTHSPAACCLSCLRPGQRHDSQSSAQGLTSCFLSSWTTISTWPETARPPTAVGTGPPWPLTSVPPDLALEKVRHDFLAPGQFSVLQSRHALRWASHHD